LPTSQQLAMRSLTNYHKPNGSGQGPSLGTGGMILSDRDRLVEMLEYYWPEIEPMCSPRPNKEGLKRVLESIPGKALGRYDYPAEHLLAHLSNVLEFVSANRFRGDPRQIANAFAGFPNVSVWTSLKLCQASPCNNPIGNRAIRAYLRRKHRELYGSLCGGYGEIRIPTATSPKSDAVGSVALRDAGQNSPGELSFESRYNNPEINAAIFIVK
jgi:hypothetical protein